MNEPIFLIDEGLIALGRALQVLYPDTVHISGRGDAPRTAAKDPEVYRWCEQRGAVLVTADFNMLRDQAILSELIQRVGLRVVWIRQIKGQRAQRETERIIGRWSYLRDRLMGDTNVQGYVLAGNGHLRGYRTIGDAVVEVLPRRDRGD